MPDGTYANPDIVENPLAHREYSLTWLTHLTLAADHLTRPWAQAIGVAQFDLLVYGLAVPFLTAMTVSWHLARYFMPLWFLAFPALVGGWFCILVFSYADLVGLENMNELCITVLAVLSETLRIPYYDLMALLFLVIPGTVAAFTMLQIVLEVIDAHHEAA